LIKVFLIYLQISNYHTGLLYMRH